MEILLCIMKFCLKSTIQVIFEFDLSGPKTKSCHNRYVFNYNETHRIFCENAEVTLTQKQI